MSDNCALTEQEKEILEIASAVFVVNRMLTKIMGDSSFTRTEIANIQRSKMSLNNSLTRNFNRRVDKNGAYFSEKVLRAVNSVRTDGFIRFPDTYYFEENNYNELIKEFVCKILRDNFDGVAIDDKITRGGTLDE